MATYITKSKYGIVFYSSGLNKLRIDTIPFDTIDSIQKKKLFSGIKIVINLVAPSWKTVPKQYSFKYEDVALPVSTNADDLITKLEAYDLGYVQEDKFTATAGQTVFDVSDYSGRGVENILVFSLGVLMDEGIDYTYDSATGEVTFTVAMGGGESIHIIHIN